MKTGYLTLIFALACAACTPRFYPPKVDVPDGYLYGEGFPRDTAALASDWWRLFGDTVLDNLVQRALENNRDVAVAASRVEEARQNLGVVRAQFLPQVGIGVTAEGEYTPQTKIVQTYAVEPSLSWEIALFGQLRNPNGRPGRRSPPRNGRCGACGCRWPRRSPRPTSRCSNTNATWRSPGAAAPCGANRPH